MQNLLISDFYRLKRQKSNLVLLIVFLALALFSAVMTGFILGNAPWLDRIYKSISKALEFDLGEEFRMTFSMIYGAANTRLSFVTMTMSQNAPIFTVLFIALFILQPVRAQYLKNIISEHPRSYFVVSETIFLMGFTLILTLSSVLLSFLVSFVFFTGIPLGDLPMFLSFVFVKFLLLFALSLVLTLFISLFRRAGLGIAFSIIYTAVISASFFQMADMLLEIAGKTNFRLSYLTPIGNYYMLINPDTKRILIGLIVGTVYAAAAFLLRLLQFKRRDVI